MKKKKFTLKTKTDIKVFLLFLLEYINYPIDKTTLLNIVVDNTEELTIDYDECLGELSDTDRYRVIFNTVPTLLLEQTSSRCLKIDLASVPGIAGEDVIHARGLPGKKAPESSGELIARRLLQLMKGVLT
jgi:hypothetical protein